MKETKQTEVPFEGIVYGEISGWITIVGMIIAILGLIASLLYGGRIINETGLMKDLFVGKGEGFLWARDSAFNGMPAHYWFFRQRMDGDELSMIGIIVAIYGGIAGVWGMFASMFRKMEVLFYKKGLYVFCALILGAIMTLAATGVIALR